MVFYTHWISYICNECGRFFMLFATCALANGQKEGAGLLVQ